MVAPQKKAHVQRGDRNVVACLVAPSSRAVRTLTASVSRTPDAPVYRVASLTPLSANPPQRRSGRVDAIFARERIRDPRRQQKAGISLLDRLHQEYPEGRSSREKGVEVMRTLNRHQVRVYRSHAEADDGGYMPGTPAERLSQVWELTKDAWAFSGVPMLNEDYKDMLQCLLEEKVRFLLVPAYAVAVYGYPRATKNMDVFVRAAPDGVKMPKIKLVAGMT